ncbi:MAG TPA: ATP-binding protein [Phycisphaerae bacterium]|nr:ATP-binding protein [Phycisphaerae bacterium]HRW52510.1 ATP-binding protein [Phycisphaerae bacterium]
MTLGRRLTVTTALLLAGLVLLGAASVSGLAGLRDSARVSRDEYLELRMIQRAESIVEDLHGRTRSSDFDRHRARGDVESAIRILDEFLAFQDTQRDADPTHQRNERDRGNAARARLFAIINETDSAGSAPQMALEHVEAALSELDRLATQMDRLIAVTHDNAAAQLHQSIISISILAAALALATILIGVHHYRSIMTPIRRLQRAMRRIATGEFSERISESGDAELAALATDLNRMASELESVYRDLEEKVRTKSRELVRSERLASVGFLAAGVAHEINNPLNIMSGYAELAIARLRRTLDEDGVTELRESLQTVCNEAFRCKEIVQKLLSLAKMGDGDRSEISMAQVLDEVVFMVRAVRSYRDRSVELRLPERDALSIRGNESEMKQVALNLVINAMNAVSSGVGHVVVSAVRENGHVVISVIDNGRGMAPDTMEKVFEPFFAEGDDESGRGAGLGLSISHAIIEAHGGHISAQSDGLGRGSRFTVRLPSLGARDTRDRAA